MKSFKFAAAIAVSALVCSTAFAADEKPFSALAGVEAQAMSAPEMNAVYGQLTLPQIEAAIARVTQPPATALLVAKVDAIAAAYPVQFAQFLKFATSRGY